VAKAKKKINSKVKKAKLKPRKPAPKKPAPTKPAPTKPAPTKPAKVQTKKRSQGKPLKTGQAKATKKGLTKAPAKVASKARKAKKASKVVKAKVASKAPPKVVVPELSWSDFFTPLDDRVLLRPSPAVTQTAGGIFLPDTSAESERPNEGHVLAVGPGPRSKKGSRRPMDVQLGDRVLFGSYSGTRLKLQGQDVVLLKETDILAIV
jgi:chaperonin GroES